LATIAEKDFVASPEYDRGVNEKIAEWASGGLATMLKKLWDSQASEPVQTKLLELLLEAQSYLGCSEEGIQEERKLDKTITAFLAEHPELQTEA
jgi:hypothetical protein